MSLGLCLFCAWQKYYYILYHKNAQWAGVLKWSYFFSLPSQCNGSGLLQFHLHNNGLEVSSWELLLVGLNSIAFSKYIIKITIWSSKTVAVPLGEAFFLPQGLCWLFLRILVFAHLDRRLDGFGLPDLLTLASARFRLIYFTKHV